MNAPARLGLYGAGLVAVFTVAFTAAGAVVPDETVQAWSAEVSEQHHRTAEADAETDAGPRHHDGGASLLGLGLAQVGYQLVTVDTPTSTDTDGEISLAVTGPDGAPVTDVELEHDKELHLIVVRADGQHFRHVHPEPGAEGTWTVPWQWEAAGTYRIFVDFVPAATGEALTLSTTTQVAGDYHPQPADRPVTETTVADFEVTVDGELRAGQASALTLTVTRDGQPVTTLEPYLGAFGHLVMLREGDLAYLHVHPHGHAPRVGETSGPHIVFETTAPTPGRYLLFLDFQVDGQVHTAPLVVDVTAATRPDIAGGGASTSDGHGHDENGEGEGEGDGH
ncbi:hypothetical protein [Pseudonocardia sp. NPDC049635]|uniref:hypothetical protein n=1 Tax=Pseudonocardia sp. NPDC049635 TaxID=3155506 RepID=UPI0033E81F5D